jgi:hypothetical protein
MRQQTQPLNPRLGSSATHNAPADDSFDRRDFRQPAKLRWALASDVSWPAARFSSNRKASAPSRLLPRLHSGCRTTDSRCDPMIHGRQSICSCPTLRRRTRSGTAMHRLRACRALRRSRLQTPYRCHRRRQRRACRARQRIPETPMTADDARWADATRPKS